MSKAVDIIDGVLFVHTRHYDDVNRVIICHQKKPLRVFSDDAEKELGRPHGKWIECEEMNCHSDIEKIYICPFCKMKHHRKYDFCNCGADMREGENN